jgi:hypothetical protein
MRTQLQQPQSARRDPSAGPSPGRAHVEPDREASPIGHLQRTIGNQAVGRLLRANAAVAGVGSALVIASGDSAEELQAGAAGERARHAPAPAAPLTANDSTGAVTTLSDSGRRYFEPLVGAALGGARVHVDGRADRLTRLAGARALAYADDVFIAPDRFVPESIEGRALLGHELAHVAQARAGRPQVFRQPAVEPHYPTEDEQREIARLLSRESEGTPAAPPPAPGAPTPPAPTRRVALDAEKRRQLADELRRPYLDTLDRLDKQGGSSGTDLDEDDALEVVTQARADIYKTFGAYATQITLTRDEATTPAARRAANQVLVTFRIDDETVHAMGRTIATTHCKQCLAKLAPLDGDSKGAVIEALIATGLQEEGEKMRRVTNRSVPGSYRHGERRISLRLRPREELTHTAVHELMHALAHPVFRAAFGDEDNVNEGFTEYLTRQVFTGKTASYQSQYEKIGAVRDVLEGPFLGGKEAEESIRLAYFRGRLDLIGWQASGPEEERAVKAAARGAAGSGTPEEPKQWDAATARRWAEIYEARALARQAPSRNVLGVGLYFTRGSDAATIAVRYARVLDRTEPYAKGQLLLEGRLLGSPARTLDTLGASLGVAGEYQHPYFYLGGGARFEGTAVPAAGTTRLDVSLFGGGGVRLWQTIRVGAEAFVVIPVKGGEGVPVGGAINVGVEF